MGVRLRKPPLPVIDDRRLRRGYTVTMETAPTSRGTVLRVASDESWADVGWWNRDGSYGWTKRHYRTENLRLVRDLGDGLTLREGDA